MLSESKTPQTITISNGLLTATVLDIGASLQTLRLVGYPHSLVLGYQNPMAYIHNPHYLGAIVGRVANRISGASADINDQEYGFNANEYDRQTLHGGCAGSSTRRWRIGAQTKQSVTFVDKLPHGHMGFPGNVEVSITYRVEQKDLIIEILATTDAPTLCAFAPHYYFNLSGENNINQHLLKLYADRAQFTDSYLIPQGEPESVKNTPYDLQTLSMVPEELDMGFCVKDEPSSEPSRIAELHGGSLVMHILSSEPGIQVYDGSALDIPMGAGLDGRAYGRRAGMAIEPQRWIDAANNPSWRGQTELKPGEQRRQISIYRFID